MLQIRHIHSGLRLGLLDLSAFSAKAGISVKREIEKSGTQYLLQEMLKSPFDLRYTEHRKPMLAGRPEHISISHSHDKLAILLNEKENTGVDIELIREKVLNIAEKFVSPKERNFTGNDIEKLITLWAAKEAMYKAYGEKELEFLTQIEVEEFSGAELRGHVHLADKKRSFAMQSETIDNYKLVYILYEF